MNSDYIKMKDERRLFTTLGASWSQTPGSIDASRTQASNLKT